MGVAYNKTVGKGTPFTLVFSTLPVLVAAVFPAVALVAAGARSAADADGVQDYLILRC